jgi:hypothetical protein
MLRSTTLASQTASSLSVLGLADVDPAHPLHKLNLVIDVVHADHLS